MIYLFPFHSMSPLYFSSAPSSSPFTLVLPVIERSTSTIHAFHQSQNVQKCLKDIQKRWKNTQWELMEKTHKEMRSYGLRVPAMMRGNDKDIITSSINAPFAQQIIPNMHKIQYEKGILRDKAVCEQIIQKVRQKMPWRMHFIVLDTAYAAVNKFHGPSIIRFIKQKLAESEEGKERLKSLQTDDEYVEARALFDADAPSKSAGLNAPASIAQNSARRIERMNRRKAIAQSLVKGTLQLSPHIDHWQLVQLVVFGGQLYVSVSYPEQAPLMSRLPYGNAPMPHESYVTKGSLAMPKLPSKWMWKLIEAEVRFGKQLLVHDTSDEVVDFGAHWSSLYAHRGCRVNSIGSSRGDLHGLKSRIDDYTFPGHSLDLLACDVLMSPLESLKLLEKWIQSAHSHFKRLLLTLNFEGDDHDSALDAAERILEKHQHAFFYRIQCLSYSKNECSVMMCRRSI